MGGDLGRRQVIGPASGGGMMMGMDAIGGMSGMHTMHAMQDMQSMHNLQAMQMHGLNGNGMHAMAAMPNSLPQPMQMAYADHALIQQQQQQQQHMGMGMGMGMTAMDAFNAPAFARPPQFGHHHITAPLPHGSRQQPSSPRPPQPLRPLRASSPAPPPPKLTPLPVARRPSPAPVTASQHAKPPSSSSSTAAASSPSPPASPRKPAQATLSVEETQAVLRRDREIARWLQEVRTVPILSFPTHRASRLRVLVSRLAERGTGRAADGGAKVARHDDVPATAALATAADGQGLCCERVSEGQPGPAALHQPAPQLVDVQGECGAVERTCGAEHRTLPHIQGDWC